MAASMADIGPVLVAAFRAAHPEVSVATSFASSGAIARQVESGAPIDVVVFAGRAPMTRLEKGSLVGEPRLLFSNELVVAVREGAPEDERAALRAVFGAGGARAIAQLPSGRRLAIGNPETVPAGTYARQALVSLGLWEAMQPHLVLSEDVREAAQWVSVGEAIGGIVYRTDALAPGSGLTPLVILAPHLHEPIVYVAAVVRAHDGAAARAFVEFCATAPEAARLAAGAGFVVPRPALEEAGGEVPPTTSAAAQPARRPLASEAAHPFLLSLLVGAFALALNILVGVPVAWLLARHRFRGRALVDALILLPLALPPTVVGFFLVIVLGRTGPVGALTDLWWGWTLLFTWPGAVLASAIVSFPLFVKPLQAAFEAIPPVYFEEGELMGMTASQGLVQLGVPMAWRGLACGAALSFARAIGEFGATLMVAGNIPGKTQTLPLAIYSATATGDTGRAALYAGLLTLVALLLVLAGRRFFAQTWTE